jgi:hypothetical protein
MTAGIPSIQTARMMAYAISTATHFSSKRPGYDLVFCLKKQSGGKCLP